MSIPRKALAVVVLALGLLTAVPARAGQVYLSLGDSIAFGYDPSTASTLAPSHGDQGFVSHFADFLAGGNGGVRPTVLNLGIPGEESTSFFNPSDLFPTGPPRAWQLNSNYADATTSQNSLMLSQIAGLHAAGDQVGTVSLVFGANDIFGLIASPAFLAADAATQLSMIGATITTALTNYATVLTELQAAAPEARVFLPGYYNPFPAALDPVNHAKYDAVLNAFNPNLQSIAGTFGATYVDTYPLFVGHELEYTNIATGDVHPNQSGHAAIGGALAQAVPEPSSVISLALGTVGVAALALRRTSARRSAA